MCNYIILYKKFDDDVCCYEAIDVSDVFTAIADFGIYNGAIVDKNNYLYDLFCNLFCNIDNYHHAIDLMNKLLFSYSIKIIKIYKTIDID